MSSGSIAVGLNAAAAVPTVPPPGPGTDATSEPGVLSTTEIASAREIVRLTCSVGGPAVSNTESVRWLDVRIGTSTAVFIS
jgi:hypothetical protein